MHNKVRDPRFSDVDEIYNSHGVQFHYPSDWTVWEEQQGSDIHVSLDGPLTCQWSVSLLANGPSAEDAVEAALNAFRDTYEDLDEYAVAGRLGERDAVITDLDFVCLELTNCARICAFETEAFTVLILYQANDNDFDETKPLFEAISNSLCCESDDAWQQ